MKISVKNTLLAVTLTISLMFIVSCSSNEVDAKNENKTKSKHIVSVEVQKLTGHDFTEYISVIGTLQPLYKANLGYLNGGKIKEFLFDKGDFVNAGDTIVVIDNDILKAQYAAAKAVYELAEITYNKQNRIYKENVNSEYQLLQAKYQMEQAKANYDLVSAQLDDTYITAPFSGIVDTKFYENGEMALPGSTIIKLINTDKMKVEAGVPERYAANVRVGDEVNLSVSELSINNLKAKISYVGTSLNINDRTFPIEVVFNKKHFSVKPEMIVELNIASNNYKNLITIPENVISRTDLGYIVYVAENGIARTRKIEILSRKGSVVAVKSGLKSGDELITVGDRMCTRLNSSYLKLSCMPSSA